MGKFDGVLICTDLDGTLLRNDKSISADNKAAIDYFKAEGGRFTFVTGRTPNCVDDIHAGLLFAYSDCVFISQQVRFLSLLSYQVQPVLQHLHSILHQISHIYPVCKQR